MIARRAIRRQYTRAALQRWLERLARPWEHHFAEEELRLGRAWYRDAVLVSVELEPDLAVVTRKDERLPTFATLEWPEGELCVRASHEDAIQGRALAVAGLYEIEELVGDELAPLPPAETAGPAAPELHAPTAPHASRPAPRNAPPAPPPLELEWSLSPRGLRVQAFWRANGEHPRQAVNGHVLGGGAGREAMIRLTSWAHQSPLQSRGQGEFVLEDPERLAEFVRDELPRWQHAFPIKVAPEVVRLSRGIQRVQGWIEASIDAGEIRLAWHLRSSGQPVPEELIRRLLARPTQVVLDPAIGLLAWPEAWQPWLEGGALAEALKGNRACPRYLLQVLLERSPFRVELAGELQAWEALLRGGVAELPGLPDYLRPYQREGISWLQHVLEVGGHPLLADEMGLGKTLQTLTLLKRRWAEQPVPILVVAPASVVSVWQAEAGRWAPELPVQVVDRQTRDDFASTPALYLTSYAQLRRRLPWFQQARWPLVVLDEAHTIKNPEAKISQACWSLKADQRLALTGTPMENRPLDLWSLMRFLLPGLLGPATKWQQAKGEDQSEAVAQLRERCEPFILRRTKDRVATELPPKTEIVEWVGLSPTQARLYQGLTSGEDTLPGWQAGRMQVLSLLTRLRQICCDPALLPGEQHPWHESAKIERLLELLEPVLASGHKVVIFSQFVQLLDRVADALTETWPDLPLYELTGQTRRRGETVERFQEHDGAAAFLVSLKAGGVGITLHAADYVFLLDPWWNPAVEAQAIDRVHRIGQERPVMVYRFVTRGTIEERVEHLKAHKAALFSDLVEDVSGPTALAREFDNLYELVRYRVEG